MAGDERFSEEVQAKIVQVAMDPSRWKMTKAQRGRTLAGLSIVREFLGGEEVYGPGDAADEIIQLTVESDKFNDADLIVGLTAVAAMLTDHIQVMTGADWDKTLRTIESFTKSIELVEEPPEGTDSGPLDEQLSRSCDLVAANHASRVQEPDAQTRDRTDPLTVLCNCRSGDVVASVTRDNRTTIRARTVTSSQTV
jgi:hypothetical protein